MENVESIGRLEIAANDKLENIDGLEGLSTILNSTVISGNPLLSNLTGLSNLIKAEGYIQIHGNESLGDLCGLKNLFSTGSFGTVLIEGNLSNPTPEEIVENCL